MIILVNLAITHFESSVNVTDWIVILYWIQVFVLFVAVPRASSVQCVGQHYSVFVSFDQDLIEVNKLV